MNGSEANADGANTDDPTAWRPPFDALSAILQPGMPRRRAFFFSNFAAVVPWGARNSMTAHPRIRKEAQMKAIFAAGWRAVWRRILIPVYRTGINVAISVARIMGWFFEF
jgi:hypothetical protein